MTSSDPKTPAFVDATETFVRLGDKQPPLGVVIRVLGVDADPSTLRLTQGVCSVGSASHNHLVLHDSGTSRNHLELRLVPEGVEVRDLGSRNGVFYLGQRVEKMVLGLGSRLVVGRATLIVEADRAALDLAYAESEYVGIVGASEPMRRLFGQLGRLQGSLVPIVIEGESGVGKELVARAIHHTSPVSDGPFVAVNCGALVRDLVPSELFGHQRGAFTGANATRKGAFESADGGTLFFDEIGELPLDVQPTLLRVLELGEVHPVGSDVSKSVRVRVMAATNRDLHEDVVAGRFREDLYYRLAVVSLEVPPLRVRADDIELLSQRFAKEAGIAEIPAEVLEALQARTWPGNVRELRNAIQAYAALGELPRARRDAGKLDSALAELAEAQAPYVIQKDALVDRFTAHYLRGLMVRAGGNQTKAAQLADLDRNYLGRLLTKHGLGGRKSKGSGE